MGAGRNLIGARFGPYKLLEKVGEGGMGAVYRSEDTRTGTTVAVKVLDEARTRDPQILSRFRREARIEAALRHPNISAFHDFDEAIVSDATSGLRRRVVFLVIEWVPRRGHHRSAAAPREVHAGADRGDRRSGRGRARGGARCRDRAPRPQAEQHPAHPRRSGQGPRLRPRQGLESAPLHRDHPPTFQTTIGSLLGTAPYMAPEQLFGRGVDARTDLFSLGVVLYQMATGEVPFSGRNIVEVLQAVSSKAAAPPSYLNPDVPLALDVLILRLLAKEPEGRYPSATAVRQALAAVR